MQTIVLRCRCCRTEVTPVLFLLDQPRLINIRECGKDLIPPGVYITGLDQRRRYQKVRHRDTPRSAPNDDHIHVNLRDVINTMPYGSRGGCCGVAGFGGPNLKCARCGAVLATECSDCYEQHSVIFEPSAVEIEEGIAERPADFGARLATWRWKRGRR